MPKHETVLAFAVHMMNMMYLLIFVQVTQHIKY